MPCLLDLNKTPKQGTLQSHIKACVSSLCHPELVDLDRPLKSYPETASSGKFTIEDSLKYTVDRIKCMKGSSKHENHGEKNLEESLSSSNISEFYFSIGSLNSTEATLKDCQAVHNLHGKTGNDNPSKAGFVTGRGVPLILPSDESMKRARRLLDDCFKDHDGNKPTDDGMRSDFPTHCDGTSRYVGLLTELSEKTKTEGRNLIKNEVGCGSVKGGSSVTPETPFIASNHEHSLGRFTSTAGKFSTPISNVSLRQATTIFSKPSPPKIELQSLGGGESPKFVSATTEVDGEMSPTLDFDGSFEISSQIMNVIEGNLSQSSDNVEPSEVESQRVEARLLQEAEADRLFKPSVTAHLNFKLCPAGSLSSYSTTHKVVQEPVKPGTLWRLRRCSGRLVNKDLPSYRASHSFEKDLHFAGDFLRLDDASSFSIYSASKLKFKLDSGSVNVSYRLGDDVEVIPDSFGYAGCVEVARYVWIDLLFVVTLLSCLYY